MTDNLVTWLADLLQNDPKVAAALWIGLAVWILLNTITAVLISFEIDGIKKALRKRGIWV